MTDLEELFATLTEKQQNKKLPPVHLWHPERSGTIDIRIDAEGQWFHEGAPIQRQPLVDLFATIMREEEGTYYLVTPVEKLAIEVADVPFVAIDMDVKGAGTGTELLFTTNVGDYVVANAEHEISMHGERPYLEIRDNLTARIARSVYYRMVDIGVEEMGAMYVYSQGARFCLGSVTSE
jgi:hypothetical protein